MTTAAYLDNINKRYKLGNATEHTFRGDLQSLLEDLVTGIAATNEPQRISCGAPDYIITRKDIPVGYIEAKDLGADLNSRVYKEQFDRYRASLNNLIITDYLDFRFYLDGEFKTSIRIAEITNGKLVPLPGNFAAFETLIQDFCTYLGQTIRSSRKLAEMMAAKARMLAGVIETALNSDEDNQENSSLKDQFLAFRQVLIHDIHTREFADVYAQTIAYGMFAARLNDPSLKSFTRQEAAELIPKTNPFLRKLFQYVAGYDLDSRILWIVDGLADVFRATDVSALLKNFGSATQTQDPIIHFYETFLSEYNPALRKARGVWYTPEPVVNFIVRAVDDILKDEFGIANGIADNSMTTIKVNVPGVKKEVEKQVHRVQFLDPATGTATFLAELIKQIYSKFKGQEGIWSDYVERHLIPRLNGFEILMASYAMAHLKLDLLLKETGYKPKNEQRFRVYLTNSLEEYHADTGTLFANWLSAEANEANYVKRDTPVMVVLGNPPYSVSSGNKSKWIESLTADYKKDLNERNINPLSDDYIKFIRFGQHFIDKNGEGILAYISNNSFIDGIIHRQMRKHLLQSFDKIYIYDLHGNAKKKEVCKDGSIDQNVFDIMQGVSINIFVKEKKKLHKELAKIFHFDLQGGRDKKYDFLLNNTIGNIKWDSVLVKAPNYYYKSQDEQAFELYSFGFSIEELFANNATGVKTERDDFSINFSKKELNEKLTDLKSLPVEEIRRKYQLEKDGRDWQLGRAKTDISNNKYKITNIQYRPFDYRVTAYTGITKGFMAYPREKIMSHLIEDNIALISTRLNRGLSSGYNFVTKNILDLHLLDSAADSLQTFPLYLYPNKLDQLSISKEQIRVPNLNMEIVDKIGLKLNLCFVEDENICVDLAAGVDGIFYPLNILDYIYAVLHSPTYREKYKEFLKIDFPSVPYPKDAATYWQLVALGGELRQIHLLESPVVIQYITQFPEGGSNMVEKLNYKDGILFINETQYFANVPEVAWNFYIGGYQPAQKWLKDRKGRTLEFDDILHYQKIIVALTETDRIMKEIDRVGVE